VQDDYDSDELQYPPWDGDELQYPPSPSAVSSSAATLEEEPGALDGDRGKEYPEDAAELAAWLRMMDAERREARCSTDQLRSVGSDSAPSTSTAAPRLPIKRRTRILDNGRACDQCNVRKVKCVKLPGGGCGPCAKSNLDCKSTRVVKKAGRPKKNASKDTSSNTSSAAHPGAAVEAAPVSEAAPAAEAAIIDKSVPADPVPDATPTVSANSTVVALSAKASAEAKSASSRSSWLNIVLGSG